MWCKGTRQSARQVKPPRSPLSKPPWPTPAFCKLCQLVFPSYCPNGNKTAGETHLAYWKQGCERICFCTPFLGCFPAPRAPLSPPYHPQHEAPPVFFLQLGETEARRCRGGPRAPPAAQAGCARPRATPAGKEKGCWLSSARGKAAQLHREGGKRASSLPPSPYLPVQ